MPYCFYKKKLWYSHKIISEIKRKSVIKKEKKISILTFCVWIAIYFLCWYKKLNIYNKFYKKMSQKLNLIIKIINSNNYYFFKINQNVKCEQRQNCIFKAEILFLEKFLFCLHPHLGVERSNEIDELVIK